MWGLEPEIERDRDRENEHPGGCMWRKPHLCPGGTREKEAAWFGASHPRFPRKWCSGLPGTPPHPPKPALGHLSTLPNLPRPWKLDYFGLVSSHFGLESVPGRKGWVRARDPQPLCLKGGPRGSRLLLRVGMPEERCIRLVNI